MMRTDWDSKQCADAAERSQEVFLWEFPPWGGGCVARKPRALLIMSLPPRGQVGAIIITPTRELAIQIDEVLSHFTKPFPQFR